MEISAQNAVATVKEKFNFSVDKRPLVGLIDGQLVETDQYGLFHSKDGYLNGVKSVSPRYVPHTTDDVVAITEAAAEVFDGQISVECHFNNGHFVHMKPTNSDRKNMFNVTQGDNIFPRFMVRGGFDGSGFKASVGYYRDMCSNMAMMRTVKTEDGKNQKFARSIRHTSGLRPAMDELIETFAQLKEEWFNLTDLIADMHQRSVSLQGFLGGIYGTLDDTASGREITIHKNRTTKIHDRLWTELRKSRQLDYIQANQPEDSDDLTVSAWYAYNAVQGYEQWDSTRRLIGSSDDAKFERILRAENKAVMSAEKLALAA